ncbi:DUF3179 domain-containing (seleno)protein [Planktotalea sp.]|uniref:DUF3179 domain-containing (seleno)protein n=1 Tax=Planktotalea sp. TaxID=2029877 RepID=UPI003296C5BE
MSVVRTTFANLCRVFAFVFALICGATFAQAQDAGELSDYVLDTFGPAPLAPSGPLTDETRGALETIISYNIDQSGWDPAQTAAFETIAEGRDPRVAWLLADMLRFTWRPEFNGAIVQLAAQLLEIDFKTIRQRDEMLNHLIAWDIPAYPNYLSHKRRVLTNYVPGWERILVQGDIDWRMVSWGGVNIDTRPHDATDEICDCIPAADNPKVSSANDADWLQDDDIVFGITVNGESRAYPLRIMEVREMVNDTLGGRELGIPYCSLCGAAQAYFTDGLPLGVKRPILRTSGLLIRSNKVMFDLETYSVFDTFLGKALTGPLADIGLELEQASVITTDWGAWKAQYPETTVLVEALALGRDFDLRNSRDAKGPIFPIGDVDPRLDVHEDVIGVVTGSGTPVAFERSAAVLALQHGAQVGFEDVQLILDAGGLRALDTEGRDLGSHQAYWFAWSQFHPQTVLWSGP